MGLFSKKAVQNDSATNYINIIQNFISDNGTSMGFMSAGSVKAAANLIHPGEEINYAICANAAVGTVGGKLKAQTYNFKGKVNGIIVVTSQRIIFASSSYNTTASIYLSDIDSLDATGFNLAGAVLRIQSHATAIAVDGNKKILTPLQQKIDEAIFLNKKRTSVVTTIQEVSTADEILKFKELCDKGIITEEEFAAKKKQLLGI